MDRLAEIRQRVADRDDSNALNSACGEYNCPCHQDVPFLLAQIDKLSSQLPEGMQHCTILFKQCEKGHS